MFSIYPKAAPTFRGSILSANLDKGVKGKDFQSRKERLLILLHLLKDRQDLKEKQILSLRDAVLVSRDKEKALKLLKSFAKGGKDGWLSVLWNGRKTVLSEEEVMWRDANTYATKVSDANFLSYLRTIPDANYLHNAAVKCENAAYGDLTTQLDSLVSGISQQILSIQKEECDKQVQREVKNEEEKELKVSRVEFVRQIEDLSKGHSGSYVACSSGDE